MSVPLAGRLAVELAFFGSAAAGLYAAERPGLVVLLPGLAVVNRGLIQAWRQDERVRPDPRPRATTRRRS